MTQRKRIFTVLGGLLGAFLLYEALTTVVVYTDDAYVTSYNVAVAPEVTGRVVAVHVADNQDVKIGDPLFSIDPVPFQLDVNERSEAVAEARARLAADQDTIKGAQDVVAAQNSALTFAKGAQQRRLALGRGNFVSPEDVDAATDRETRAAASVAQAQSSVAAKVSALAMHKAALAKAEAALATAQWRLSQTQVVAPRPGTINNLTLRVGDPVTAYTPAVGVIDADGWRVIANYLQSDLRLIHEGRPAWVWLDSHPWRFHRARIQGVSRGVSRNPGVDKLLPYVEPTTDWIRLERRFPVTIAFDDPPADLKLYMGADARTVIFPW